MLIASIKRWLLKRRLRAFGLSGDSAEGLLQSATDSSPFRLTNGPIEYLIVFVRGESPSEISERVGKVSEIAKGHSGVVHHVVGPLVAVSFGTSPYPQQNKGTRASLLDDLERQLCHHIKVVHGATNGAYGMIGSEKCIKSFSFIVPDFDQVLAALATIQFGQFTEFYHEKA